MRLNEKIGFDYSKTTTATNNVFEFWGNFGNYLNHSSLTGNTIDVQKTAVMEANAGIKELDALKCEVFFSYLVCMLIILVSLYILLRLLF